MYDKVILIFGGDRTNLHQVYSICIYCTQIASTKRSNYSNLIEIAQLKK